MTRGATAGPAGRGAGRRLLPGPGRALRHDAAGRHGRRRRQGRGPGRRRHPHLDAAGARRRRRPTTSAINRNKRSIALDLRDADDAALARELARRADVVLENFRPGGLARFGLDYDDGRARPTPASSTPRSAGSAPGRARAARLRPDGAGDLRADEPHRRPGRAALPGRHLGVRRDGRHARHDRHPRRAAPPRRHRRRASTSR